MALEIMLFYLEDSHHGVAMVTRVYRNYKFLFLDRTCASLHAPTTKTVFPMVGDIPVSARIPALKEGHAMKVYYIAKTVDAFSARPGDETLCKPRSDLRRFFPNLGRRKYPIQFGHLKFKMAAK